MLGRAPPKKFLGIAETGNIEAIPVTVSK